MNVMSCMSPSMLPSIGMILSMSLSMDFCMWICPLYPRLSLMLACKIDSILHINIQYIELCKYLTDWMNPYYWELRSETLTTIPYKGSQNDVFSVFSSLPPAAHKRHLLPTGRALTFDKQILLQNCFLKHPASELFLNYNMLHIDIWTGIVHIWRQTILTFYLPPDPLESDKVRIC